VPSIRNRIAHEHHPILPRRRRRQAGVGRAIAAQFAEVAHPDRSLLASILLQVLLGGSRWISLLRAGGLQQRCGKQARSNETRS